MRQPITSTLSIEAAAARVWDAIIVGGGPAGSIAAQQVARCGVRVLVLDRASFPRPKPCGNCLNAAALATLNSCALGDLPATLGAVPLRAFHLFADTSHADEPLPGGAVLSRDLLDWALLAQAVQAGAAFLQAQALSTQLRHGLRLVSVAHAGSVVALQARIVVAADGLDGGFLRHEPGLRSIIQPGSRLASATMLHSDLAFYAPGNVYVGCAPGGYAGLTRLEDGRLNIAGCFDLELLRRVRSPAAAVSHILQQAHLPLPQINHAHWRGTPYLTRQRQRVAAERLLVVGDAAGYVEPFTGEGLAWALTSGAAVSACVVRGVQSWDDSIAEFWQKLHARLIIRRQQPCLIISYLLHRHPLTRSMVKLLAHLPTTLLPILTYLEKPYRWGTTVRGLGRALR